MLIEFFIKIVFIIFLSSNPFSNDLDQIKESGELRHLGIPYGDFVTGSGDGLDVELIKGFAKHLGVKYVFVESSWNNIFSELIGVKVKNGKNGVEFSDKVEIKGDIISNGITVLDWRKEVVNFSNPTLPTGIWLIARADSKLKPITPSVSYKEDIKLVKNMLNKVDVLAMENTCLDPSLYGLDKTGANILLQDKKIKVNELVPVIIKNNNETTLLDAADALIALQKWPGEIKVIGPISDKQEMAAATRKTSPKLLEEFNKYLDKIKNDGTYNELVKKYFPDVYNYYGDFFRQK